MSITRSMSLDDIVIGRGVTSTGQFDTAGVIYIDGVLQAGQVRAFTLSINEGGEFHGTASVQRLEVFGTVNGEVTASEHIVLRASAVVSGTLVSPDIVIHRGATLNARVDTKRCS